MGSMEWVAAHFLFLVEGVGVLVWIEVLLFQQGEYWAMVLMMGLMVALVGGVNFLMLMACLPWGVELGEALNYRWVVGVGKC